ncbi:unnamed protein product [Arctia plantaginis]|uniref:Uncharacterized protein n=1 Tax=Arctia plantaginis TaxID=874455 RepID=A0A8S1B0I9_ARCPL|nr:unnamed protein product [Arctia plantaginis]
MGNVLSSASTREDNAESVNIGSVTMDTNVPSDVEKWEGTEKVNENEARARAKEEEMNEFKKQLSLKREQRREILARHRAEKEELERSLQREKAAVIELCESNKILRELLTSNSIEIPKNLQTDKGESALTETLLKMREEFILIKVNNTQLRKDLAETNSALQSAYSDIADLNYQNTESMKQIQALKEVVSVSKTMINLREEQLNELKNKLNEIERTVADRETNLLSADLRQEYERQLQNIRTLRGLYEERARLAEVTRQGLVRELDEHKVLHQVEVKKCKDLVEKVEELESRIDSLIETIETKNSQISSCQEETNGLRAEMAVVNKLFSQVLLGNKTKQDLDMLAHRLEENHGILTQMAERENGSEMSSALPKLLLELVSQVDEREDCSTEEPSTTDHKSSDTEIATNQESDSLKATTSVEDIVEKLPKVWKVLIELLSHQNRSDVDSSEKVTTCYKSVNTASGPVLVPSVSQTYIRLKDLIIEKLGLIKEVNRMKQLNTHLETRLEEQERRLCLVTSELSKTWHVVGRLRRHHHQLHTHEKILKYELQQKRKLLNELKEELEYCREKWEQAREKNTQSEKDWRNLRAEFSSRKTKLGSPPFNNSGESGYSDERPSDESSESNDESEYVAEPLMRCKKKVRKSFETIIDSSTDINLAAEREDPTSDMLDVADLPLDTQESEETHASLSEPSKSEIFSKHEKICEETEDEVADITHDDSGPEEEILENAFSGHTHTFYDTVEENKLIPSSISLTISKNIKWTDEIVLQEQERSDQPECSTAALRKETDTTVKTEEQLTSMLDNLFTHPSDSNNIEIENVSTGIVSELDTHLENTKSNVLEHKECISEHVNIEITENQRNSGNSQQTCEELSTPDFKAILENVRKQNERLAKKDKRLKQLEKDCSVVVKDMSSTLNSGDRIIEKLDSLHKKQKCYTAEEEQSKEDSPILEREEAGPSTSNEIDHEARFAARDLRLKRLEEQTKSLVNKVNKTTSKGIKINYKLEELHNIYGSENSRAGTPSEENEDKNNESADEE